MWISQWTNYISTVLSTDYVPSTVCSWDLSHQQKQVNEPSIPFHCRCTEYIRFGLSYKLIDMYLTFISWFFYEIGLFTRRDMCKIGKLKDFMLFFINATIYVFWGNTVIAVLFVDECRIFSYIFKDIDYKLINL